MGCTRKIIKIGFDYQIAVVALSGLVDVTVTTKRRMPQQQALTC